MFIWSCVDFQENKKGILTSRFASDPILVQGFVYNIVQYAIMWWHVARTNKEGTIHKFLNKEKNKKRYDMCVDGYVTVGFENSGTMEKAHRKHFRLNYVRKKLIHESI